MPNKSDHSTSPGIARRQGELILEMAETLTREVGKGHPADATLSRIFRAHSEFGARDRRFYGQALYSFFRWHGWLAALPIGHRVALSYYMDASVPHPSMDSLLADRPSQPLGALTISEKATSLARWLGQSNLPQIEALVPDWVPSAIFTPENVPATDHARRCIASFQERPPVWLRVQSDKIDDVLRHCEGHQHPHVAGAFALKSHPNLDQIRREVGPCFEVQDLASQCVVAAGAPQRGTKWWDVCAGAGGKSLQLASLLGKDGHVFSTDIRPAALRELDRRAKTSGISNLNTAVLDASMNDPESEPFDGILVDAPCSGMGTWSRNPDARWRTTLNDVADHAQTQAALLRRAVHHLKPGGTLLYAVCTITRAETTDIVNEFLREHPNVSRKPCPHPLTAESTNGEIWIWPWDGPCDGMYVAVLRTT